MSTRKAENRNYYIQPGTLEVKENFGGDAHRFSVWQAGKVMAKMYYPTSPAFGLTEDGAYMEVEVRPNNTYIGDANYGKTLYLYIRLNSGDDYASLVFSATSPDVYTPYGVEKTDDDGNLMYTAYYVCIGTAAFSTSDAGDSYSLTWDSGTLDTDDYWSNVGELNDAFDMADGTITPKKRFSKLQVGGAFSAESMEAGTVMRLPNGSRMEVPDGEGNVVAGIGNKDGYLIWGGGADGDSSVFSVTKTGKMRATEAEISGNITAKAAVFSGYSQNDFVYVNDVYTFDEEKREYHLDGQYSHIRTVIGAACVLPVGKEYVGRRIVLYDASTPGGLIGTLPSVDASVPYCVVCCQDDKPIYGFNNNDIHREYDNVTYIYFVGGAMEFLAVPYGADSCRWFVITDTSTYKFCDKSLFTTQKRLSLLYYGIVSYNATAGAVSVNERFNAVGVDGVSVRRYITGSYVVSLSSKLTTYLGESVSVDLTTDCLVTVMGYGYSSDGSFLPVVANITSIEPTVIRLQLTSKNESMVDGSFAIRIEFIG